MVVGHVAVGIMPYDIYDCTTVSDTGKGRDVAKCIKKQFTSSSVYTSKNSFHMMESQINIQYNSRLILHTANTGDYKGSGFADNLYKLAVFSYGRSILVLHLALNGGCW